jgi:hypothetical protein
MSLVVTKRQACYDGALGARAMHFLQLYGKDEPDYDRKAYTIASTYQDGNLKMYTSHVAPPRNPSGRPEYHMTHLRSFDITDTPQTCRDGLRAFRNARDWAQRERDKAIEHADDIANFKEAETVEEEEEEDVASPAASFVTAVDTEEAYTMTQEGFRLSPFNDDAQGHRDSDSSQDATVETLPAKRSKGQKGSQRKRHNADVSTCAGHGYGSVWTQLEIDARAACSPTLLLLWQGVWRSRRSTLKRSTGSTKLRYALNLGLHVHT